MSEFKQYSLAEVAKHNSNKSVWFVIHNNVYDVTEFLNEHPGGEEVLLEQGGRTASEAFEDVGHSSDAREMMKKFKVGEIIESERTTVNERSTPDWPQRMPTKKTKAPIANGCYRLFWVYSQQLSTDTFCATIDCSG
ncbi:cytochrome b5-like [Bradysia coprophila]|uniref:cytochrome b5-like n=1 Tax=Bradysia coprophila TaxID=38358 RepID=UPI00187D92CA|nr:cytochrome b5-like [Bradysia coprophila]